MRTVSSLVQTGAFKRKQHSVRAQIPSGAGSFTFKRYNKAFIFKNRKILNKFLQLQDGKASLKILIFYILAAYAFGVGARVYWAWALGQDPGSVYGGHLMINTNDGYYWAEGARDILRGTNNTHSTSAITAPISMMTAFLARILPLSFENIILWLSSFVGSLLVVPIILIGHKLRQTSLGFAAALLAVIALSYYNRTMTGYYDTDMLVVVLPTFVVFFIVSSLECADKNSKKYLFYLLATAFTIIFYRWFYAGSYSLMIGTALATLFYIAVFKRDTNSFIALLFILGAAFLPRTEYQIVFCLALFGLFGFVNGASSKKVVIPLFVALGVGMIASNMLDPILLQLKNYVFKSEITGKDGGLKFYSVVQTVMEAGKIPFDTFVNRISGHIVTFFVSLAGLGLMLWRHPVLIVWLAMVGLGFLSFNSGLRFSVYAVPAMAFGFAFFLFSATNFMAGKIRAGVIAFGVLLALAPNLYHIKQYLVPTVFNTQEVQICEHLKHRAQPKDYVISWWDYGFPLRYFSDLNTLVDGAKHSGNVNFAPSFIISAANQAAAAKLARLEVEYTQKKVEQNITDETLELASKDFAMKPNEFLSALASLDISRVQKTRDIYLFLPERMFHVFFTLRFFSNLDVETGEKYPPNYISYAAPVAQNNGLVLLNDGSRINMQKGIVEIGGRAFSIKRTITTQDRGNAGVEKILHYSNPQGQMNVIVLRDLNAVLVLDERMFSSLFVQLFVFENYDPRYFEPVSKNKLVKIYKLKI